MLRTREAETIIIIPLRKEYKGDKDSQNILVVKWNEDGSACTNVLLGKKDKKNTHIVAMTTKYFIVYKSLGFFLCLYRNR